MKLNNTLPKIEVDPECYHVTADGVRLVCEPADVLPLSQTYFLFQFHHHTDPKYRIQMYLNLYTLELVNSEGTWALTPFSCDGEQKTGFNGCMLDGWCEVGLGQ